MAKMCDNKSVGVIIRDGERMVIIKRKNYPKSYACVAGHLDGDEPLKAAVKEACEEVELSFSPDDFKKRMAHASFPNPCKRDGGHEHEWFVYEVSAPGATPKAGSDAREAKWMKPSEIAELVRRTEDMAKKHGVLVEDLARSTPAVVNDPEWDKNLGMEPVWIFILRQLHIL